MAVIGNLVATKEGGWAGLIKTMTINVKVRFVPNDNREHDQAPAFRVLAGQSELGVAWRQQSVGEHPLAYLSVRFDDPLFPEPMFAALFESADGKVAQLVWNRRRSGS